MSTTQFDRYLNDIRKIAEKLDESIETKTKYVMEDII